MQNKLYIGYESVCSYLQYKSVAVSLHKRDSLAFNISSAISVEQEPISFITQSTVLLNVDRLLSTGLWSCI